MVKDSKTLEDIYTERFTKQFVLPEIEEKKIRLARIKEQASPINFQQLKEHQRLYFERKRQKQIAKQKSQELEKNEQTYKPPTYVPVSYLLVENEQRDKEIKQLEKEEKRIEAVRNKEKLIEFLEENFRERVKQDKLKKKNKKQEREHRTLETAPLTYQQARERGNNYFQEMKKMIKRKPTAPVNIEPDPPTSKIFPEDGQYMKELHVKQFERLRSIRVAHIINDQKCGKSEREKLLKLETSKILFTVDKLDELVHRKEMMFKLKKPKQHELEETAGMVLTSIQAKLALLEMASPKKKKKEPEKTVPLSDQTSESEALLSES